MQTHWLIATDNAEQISAIEQMIEDGRYHEALETSELYLAEQPSAKDSTELLRIKGEALYHLDRTEESISIFRQLKGTLESQKKHDLTYVKVLIGLGALNRKSGQYERSESLYKEATTILQNQPEGSELLLSDVHMNLAVLYFIQSLLKKSEQEARNSLEIRERKKEQRPQKYGEALDTLSVILREQGRINEAIEMAESGLEFREDNLRKNHPNLADSLNNLGTLYYDLYDFRAAEEFFQRTLAIEEDTYEDPNHESISTTLNNLAEVYSRQRQYEAALDIHNKIITSRRERNDYSNLALSLSNRANVLSHLKRYEEAISDYQESLKIERSISKGAHSHNIGNALINLGELYREQELIPQAIQAFKDALVELRNTVGEKHDMYALALNNLAATYEQGDQLIEAKEYFEQALAARKQFLPPNHPNLAHSYSRLARVQAITGEQSLALENSRKAVQILSDRIQEAPLSVTGRDLNEIQSYRHVFENHLGAIAATISPEEPLKSEFSEELATTLQLAQASETAAVLSKMSARQALGNEKIGQLIREQQDKIGELRQLETERVTLSAETSEGREQALIDATDQKIAELKISIQERTNAISELVDTSIFAPFETAALTTLQSHIDDNEAIASYVSTDRTTFLIIIRRDSIWLNNLSISRAELKQAVSTLRSGLDNSQGITSFDVHQAWNLYQNILYPGLTQLQGIKKLIYVPDGPLASIPLDILVTQKPGQIERPEDYRTVSWLDNKYTLSVLPAVVALHNLNSFAGRSEGSEPFIGFGDPVLLGKGNYNSSAQSDNSQQGEATNSLDVIRRLPPLQRTRKQIETIAEVFNVNDPEHVFLSIRATESQLKTLPLEEFRIIAFASHGLLSQETETLGGSREPSIVLTPPKTADTPDNDGLLTTSEIAALRMDADWVILSACNTASTDGSTFSEGFSGLAKAFFYAGARSLLISHWYVSEHATTLQIKYIFSEFDQAAEFNRADALRTAKIHIRNKSLKAYAHPSYWAPFVIVGRSD